MERLGKLEKDLIDNNVNTNFAYLNYIKRKLVELENKLYEEDSKNIDDVANIIELVQLLQRENN